MNILLTGGYGCIGSWIARNLLLRGRRVWVYDLREDLKRMKQVMDEDMWKQVRFIQGDVADLPARRAAMEDHAITHVIHLAGLQVPTCRADPLLGAPVNVIGTLAVFEAVKALKDQVRRLVYASSAAVFGPWEDYQPDMGEIGCTAFLKEQPRTALPDDAPLNPTTHYGVFKRANEGNARVYFLEHGVSSIGLRPWAVYGVGRDFGLTSEPTKAIKALAIGRNHHISYGGYQDLQFAGDVADSFIRCLEVPYQGANSYNLRGAVVGMSDFHRVLCELEPRAVNLISHGIEHLPIAHDLSDERLQKDLGPMPKTPLMDGIRQTLTRFRELHAAGRLDLSDLP